MSAFYLGDRVRIVASDYDLAEDPNLAVGSTATVVGVEQGACLIRTDEGPRHTLERGEGWCFYEDELELLEGGAA